MAAIPPQRVPPSAPPAEPGTSGPASANAPLAQALDRQQKQGAQLARKNQELVQLLDRRTRRVSQLIGEREQLERRLVASDQRVQQLNRELGAFSRAGLLPSAVSRLRPVWQALHRSLARMGVGLRTPSRPPQPLVSTPHAEAESSAPQDTADEAALIPFAKEQPPRPIVAVVAFGLDQEALVNVLQIVDRYCQSHAMRPLVLTDCDDFALFRARRLLFEYLPDPEDGHARAPELQWRLYRQRRLALIRRKWRPTRIVAFGPVATRAVQLWKESPFEAPDIGELVRRPGVEG